MELFIGPITLIIFGLIGISVFKIARSLDEDTCEEKKERNRMNDIFTKVLQPTQKEKKQIDTYCKFHATAKKYAKYVISLNNAAAECGQNLLGASQEYRNAQLQHRIKIGDAIRQKLLQNARNAQIEYQQIMGWSQ